MPEPANASRKEFLEMTEGPFIACPCAMEPRLVELLSLESLLAHFSGSVSIFETQQLLPACI